MDPIAVYSGTLPGDWAITKENNGNPVQPPAGPIPVNLRITISALKLC